MKRLEDYSKTELKNLAEKILKESNLKISKENILEVFKWAFEIRDKEKPEKIKIVKRKINDEILRFANNSQLGVRSYNSVIYHYGEEKVNQLIKDLESREILFKKGIGRKTMNEIIDSVNKTYDLDIEKIRIKK